MTRAQLVLGSALPTGIALVGAAYVALAYYRATEVEARRHAADAIIARTVSSARAWSAQLASDAYGTMTPLERACRDRLPTGSPASLMAYIAPLAVDLPASADLEAGDDLVGWSTWGLISLPVHGAIRAEPFSRTVLAVLGEPTRWERLVWWRDRRSVPFVDQMRSLAVVVVHALRPEVELAVAVYDIGAGRDDQALICQGRVAARATPRPVTDRLATPPGHVAFTISEQSAIDSVIRYTALHRLCGTGGERLCGHAAGRL